MIDLYNHSIYSEGFDEPVKVIENAPYTGLFAPAPCDHDFPWGLAETRMLGFFTGKNFENLNFYNTVKT